jgi:hypothetical protein
MAGGYSSSNRVPAQQAQSPKFNYHTTKQGWGGGQGWAGIVLKW